GIYRVITPIDKRYFEIDERIAGNGAAGSRFENAFLDRRAKILRHCSAEDLIDPLESTAAFEWFKDDLTIAELAAAARLLLMSSLNLAARGDRLLVWNLRWMERYLNMKTIIELIHDGFDVKLTRAREDEFFRLRITFEGEARILFKKFMESGCDLLFLRTRLPFDGECDRGLRIVDLRIDDRLCLVAQGVACLRVL